MESELAYYNSAVHRFNHYTTRTPQEQVNAVKSKRLFMKAEPTIGVYYSCFARTRVTAEEKTSTPTHIWTRNRRCWCKWRRFVSKLKCSCKTENSKTRLWWSEVTKEKKDGGGDDMVSRYRHVWMPTFLFSSHFTTTTRPRHLVLKGKFMLGKRVGSWSIFFMGGGGLIRRLLYFERCSEFDPHRVSHTYVAYFTLSTNEFANVRHSLESNLHTPWKRSFSFFFFSLIFQLSMIPCTENPVRI